MAVRVRVRLLWGLAVAVALPPACRPAQHLPEELPCNELAISGDSASITAALAQNPGTLVFAGEAKFMCPCGAARVEARGVHGDTEARSVQGGTEQRGVQGNTEQRSVHGATEARNVQGDTEQRGVQGDTEQRAVESRSVQGDTEQRTLSGATESRGVQGATEARTVSCSWDPHCGGFSVFGANVTQVFDGRQLVAANSSCVPVRH